MANQLSHKQLQDWYQKFSKELLEKADIDVNLKEDIGRVKAFHITNRNTAEPANADVKFTYAYMAHNGTEHANPAPDNGEFKDYIVWMTQNLNPKVTDDQIQMLYDLSREGKLTITSPYKEIKDMQMVYTDKNGNITTSQPASAFLKDANSKAPVPPQSSNKAEDYGLNPPPQAPDKPANMNPGFLSWLGYLLGMDTDYARKVRYDKEMETFQDEKSKWDQYIQNGSDSEQQRFEAYRQAQRDHEDYQQELAIFVQFNTMAVGAEKLAGKKLMKSEQNKLQIMHNSTARGHWNEALNKLNTIKGFEERTDRVIRNLVGHDPHVNELTEWLKKAVFLEGAYTPSKMDLPRNPYSADQQPQQWADFQKKWSDLSALAGFAALADPKITGHPEKIGCTADEAAKLRFGPILRDMFTYGRPNAKEYFVYFGDARSHGMEALKAYHNNDPKPLGALLGRVLRETNREATILSNMEDHTINTTYLIGKLYNTLQSDPNLLAASGLSEKDLEEARANMELYNVIQQGIDAKHNILEHALGKRTMSPEALTKAVGDYAFYLTVEQSIVDCFKRASETINKSEEYRKYEYDYAFKPEDAAKVKRNAEKERKNGNVAEADKLMNQFGQMMHEADLASSRLSVLDCCQRPTHKIVMQLLDKNWMTRQKSQLLAQSNISKIGNMDRKALGELFSKHDNQIMPALAPAPKPAAAPQKQEPDLKLQQQNPGPVKS